MILTHCAACGDVSNLYQHHLIPRALGGSDDPTNLITLCGICHAKAHGVKSAWHTRALTHTALQHKRLKNERIGGALAYGYSLADDGVTLVENATEQKAIATARELHAAGLSLRKIADALATYGFTARKGGKFGAQQIKNMVA